MNDINDRLDNAPIVPLIQTHDIGSATSIAEALFAGGLVLRPETALACLTQIASSLPGAIVRSKHSVEAGQVDTGLRHQSRLPIVYVHSEKPLI